VFIARVRAYKSKLAAGDTAGADAQRAVIIEKFINAGELQVNLSSWTVQHTLVRAASSDAHCFDAAADEICKLMSTDIWHKFTRSVEYLSLTAEERNGAYSTALVEHPSAAAAVSNDCRSEVHKQQAQMAPAHSGALTAAADDDDGYCSSTCSTISSSSMGTLMSSDSRLHVYSGDDSPPRLSNLSSTPSQSSSTYASCEGTE
jgi:Regulator of G protein signaling domain